MALLDFIAALPEDKREAYKAEVTATEAKLAKAVVIETKEDAQKLVETNELLKAVNQSFLDKKDADRMKTFETERLPKLLEAERAKGQKQPWEIEIEKLKAENEVSKNESLREKQKNRALAKATELGIPTALIDRFVGFNDEETDAALKLLADTVIPYRENAVKAALEKIGSQPSPKGGDFSGKKVKDMTPDEAMQYAKQGAPQLAEVLAAQKK